MSDAKKNVYLALAAVGWADGNLDADEADAIAKLALEDGLDLEEVCAVENAIRTPVSVDTVDLSGLAEADRIFVYAVAAWLAYHHDHGVHESFRYAAFNVISMMTGTGYATAVACALGYRSPDDKYAAAPKARFPDARIIARI